VRAPVTVLVPALLVGLGRQPCALAQENAVTIDVDATAARAPIERVWAYHGYDEVNYTTTPEGEALLRELSLAHTAPVYVRTHFLFNTGDGTPAMKWGSTNLYSEDASGAPIYDYTLIDGILDTTVGAGALPLLELGFMPQALSRQPTPYENSGPYTLDSGSFHPPKDYGRWAELVRTFARHTDERYPDAGSRWQWELWNEPDIAYWHGTFEEYAELFDHTEAALHSVLPDAPLGGPAVAIPESDFLWRFLEHCAKGVNAVTGGIGTRLDFVSFHAKGGVVLRDGHVQMDLGNQLRLHRAGFDAVQRSAFAGTPVVISEADPDGCAACPATQRRENAYRHSPAYGAYEVAMMKRSLELAADLGVPLRGVLTWAFTFPGSPYFAGYRALSTNGIHLPVFNAFKLLGSLSGDRLPLRSSGARPLDELIEQGVRGAPDVDGMATIDGDRIQILVWSYHDELTDAEPSPIALRVRVPAAFGARARVTHVRADETHGDAFTVWRSQGSPVSPSEQQRDELRAAMEPVALERDRVVELEGGAVELGFDLPRFGLSLVTLVPDGAALGTPPRDEAGCSCSVRSRAASARGFAALLAVLGVALGRRFVRSW